MCFFFFFLEGLGAYLCDSYRNVQENSHENTVEKHAGLVSDGVSDSGIMGSGAAAICLLVNRSGSHATARHMRKLSEQGSLCKDLLL